MKKQFLLIFLSFLFSCGGGDDSSDNYDNNIPVLNDVLTINGTDYNLNSGNLTGYDTGDCSLTDSPINLDLDIFSSGITWNCEDEIDPSNNGEIIYFEMWTSQDQFLDSATYQIISNGDEDDCFSPGDITYADYVVGFDGSWDSLDWMRIVEGTVNVERSGNNYNITWDVTGESGEVISGNYTGTLSYCGN